VQCYFLDNFLKHKKWGDFAEKKKKKKKSMENPKPCSKFI